MRIIAHILSAIAVIACGLGFFQVWTAFSAPDASAPQQAAGVAFGIGIAVIPYCVASLFQKVAATDLLARPRD